MAFASDRIIDMVAERVASAPPKGPPKYVKIAPKDKAMCLLDSFYEGKVSIDARSLLL